MIYPDEPTGNFGKRLALARRAHGLTAVQVAGMAGLLRSRISRLERGTADPSLDDLRRIVRAIGVDVAYLLATRPGADDAHAARHLRRKARKAPADPDDVAGTDW
jgi:transcriptional regulator with XRE-family HTH domain